MYSSRIALYSVKQKRQRRNFKSFAKNCVSLNECRYEKFSIDGPIKTITMNIDTESSSEAAIILPSTATLVDALEKVAIADDEDEDNDDDEEEEEETETEKATTDKKKKKKKKKPKKKKTPSNFGTLLPKSRLLTGFTDYYTKYGQTDPPTKPVEELFPKGDFPLGEIQPHGKSRYPLADSRTTRITEAEKRYSY